MTTLRRFSIVLIALCAWGAPSSASGWTHAEANGDAASTMGLATSLVGPGNYYASLGVGDEDWFRFPAADQPSCVSAEAIGSGFFEFTLGSNMGPLVTTGVPRGASASLVMAAPAGEAPVTGFAQGNGAIGYGFTFDQTLFADATREAGDAGGMPESAQPAPGACFRGALNEVFGAGDVADVYSVQLDAGDTIVYSLATATALPVSLTLLDAAGTPVAPTVSSGGAGVFAARTPGTYYLSTAATFAASEVEYIIGLLGPDPPGSHCRPTCVIE